MGSVALRLFKFVGLLFVVVGVTAILLGGMRTHGQVITAGPSGQVRAQIFGGSPLGVEVRDVDDTDIRREKLAGPAGAVVEDVETDGPAAKAGVKAGDVFTSFDGEKVRGARHFQRLVEETPDGREVAATVVRNGAPLTLKLTPMAPQHTMFGPLGGDLRSFNFAFPDSFPFADRRDRGNTYGPMTVQPDAPARLGVNVQELSEQLGDYFGVRNGLLVESVEDGTPAKAAGLKAGDVIVRVNGTVVRTADELRRRLAESEKEATISVVRDKKETSIKVLLTDAAPRRIIR